MAWRLALAALVGISAAFVGAAAASAATARASDPVIVYAGPGEFYRPLGRLARNEVVTLAQCTPSARWCLVERGGPRGWVLASYLIGSAAKVEATPWRPLVNPFRHPLGWHHW